MSNIEYLESKIGTLNSDQFNLWSEMRTNNRLNICIPTGSGKGYIMMVDLLNRIIKSDEKVFTIASHRLMLNGQHMDDIFNMTSPLVGDIGFIFVGSSRYDITKFQQDPKINSGLFSKGLSFNDIFQSTTRKFELAAYTQKHIQSGRKVVILTTYHSLNCLSGLEVGTLYCDEAHTLATDTETAQFKENFESITYKNCYFFTATPKDLAEDGDFFLMNNESVFGKRIGLTFKECVEKGYIVTPVVHIAMPQSYDSGVDYKSVENMAKFVEDTFRAHSEFVRKNSCDPDKIEPKLLVKCPGVDEMWKIRKLLVGKMDGVKICAGASWSNTNYNHYIDDEGISGRGDYLDGIKAISGRAIVLHFDVMGEGVNITGFTGVMFLGGRLPTIVKTLQNTGRATRLHPEDRNRFRKGEIKVGEYEGWIKPFCAVIIPFFDRESEMTSKRISEDIKELRDSFDFNPVYYVSVGSDLGSSGGGEEMEGLNDSEKVGKKVKLIEEIKHNIEVLDRNQADAIKRKEILDLTLEDWFNFANNKVKA